VKKLILIICVLITSHSYGQFWKELRSKEKPDSLHKFHTVFLPGIGYTLQTSWAAILSTNMVFKTGGINDTTQKTSIINLSITGTLEKQLILPIQANIWSKNKKWNWVTDFRIMQYPSLTYGLGIKSSLENVTSLNYNYIKWHQTVLKSITDNLFVGGGIYFDGFSNVEEIDKDPGTTSAFDKYGFATSSVNIGPIARVVYDNRMNPVNPQQGWYFNGVFRKNMTSLGSESESESVLLEARKYVPFPANSKNILAFWSYNALTLAGKPYYLMLPSIGWDENYNTGRGYIQGRFRGKQMSYLETEYRFPVTANEKWGGVVFVNAESFSKDIQTQLRSFAMGYGLGVRFQLNKHSKTNLCLDYAWGRDGSHGIFVNLGEVF
jgi:hypothetical protein